MAINFDWNTVPLDFGNWEEEKILALDLPVVDFNIKELLGLLDVPFWTNDDKERWSVTPHEVIKKSPGTSGEQERVEHADLTYPIDVLENKGKWFVLDGLHRLAKVYTQDKQTVRARIVPHDRLPEIASEYPIELPDTYKKEYDKYSCEH